MKKIGKEKSAVKKNVGEKRKSKKSGGKKRSGGKKSGGKKMGKNHNKEQILNMFKKSENLKCSNMVALKYGCVQIWLRSNMVALKYGRTQIWLRSNMAAPNVEHRTLEEWLRTLFSSCR